MISSSMEEAPLDALRQSKRPRFDTGQRDEECEPVRGSSSDNQPIPKYGYLCPFMASYSETFYSHSLVVF